MSAGISWPGELPLPLVDYTGRPTHQTLASPLENAIIQRRSRGTSAGIDINVQWVLTIAQYDTFKDFFVEDLGNGTAIFALELRHPKTSELATWWVRFRGPWESIPMEAFWTVSASLFLVRQETVLPVPAPPLNWQPFLVMPEEPSESESSGGGYIPFVVQENSPYFVRIL